VIEDMRKDVKAASKVPGSNVAALNQVVDRVEQIEVDIRNPTSKLVSVSGKIAFAQMLGSLSNFILNLTQIPLLTMPHLGAEYGYGKANLQLAMAFAKQMRSLKKQGTLSELGKWLDMRHGLVGNELDLMQQLHDSGFLDLTQSFDLIDAANNPSYQENELSMNVMKVIALPQHVSEIVNRQVTALATIRLEMARSGSPLKAYRAAIKAIDETHFNYSKENRSKLMTGNTQSMLFKFKQYPQQAAFLFVHTAKLALDGSTKLDSDGNKLDGTRPSERTKARKQLAGVLGMQILVAGTLGLPVFAEAAVAASGVAGFKLAGSTGAYVGVAGAIILAAALAFGDDDGEEFDVEVKKWFIKNFGYGIGSSLASGVIPRGLSTRLDASELIIRRPEEKRTPTDTINAWMLSLLGPILGGIVYNAGIGVKEIAEGDIAKGATKLIPVKAIKDLVTSWKWANDGMNVTNKDGEIITPVSKADIFFKSIGINPTSVVNAREYDNAKFTLHNALLKKQQKALKELREETDKTKRFNAIIKYNKSAPLGYEIDSDKVRGVIAREIKYKGKPNVVTGNPVQEDYLNKNTKELRPAY
ncbi:MAG: PLxRFG domain-containing protein, partial [Nitrosomonas sp.]|nr:PLxRFG domain-containing protein [Nitrosomonas sp.]